jgi:hypothetical protein
VIEDHVSTLFTLLMEELAADTCLLSASLPSVVSRARVGGAAV